MLRFREEPGEGGGFVRRHGCVWRGVAGEGLRRIHPLRERLEHGVSREGDGLRPQRLAEHAVEMHRPGVRMLGAEDRLVGRGE